MFGDYINTTKTTFYKNALIFNKHIFKITSLQVNKEKLFIDNYWLFTSLCLSLSIYLFIYLSI